MFLCEYNVYKRFVLTDNRTRKMASQIKRDRDIDTVNLHLNSGKK